MFNLKKKIIPHILDRERLAEAISIYSDKINLDKMWFSSEKCHLKDSIQLDEHLRIDIDSFWHTKDYSLRFSLDYFYMEISTYVDDIKMAYYEFELDITNNKELYRKWDCKDVQIIHAMPNQFIDLMNDWSKKIVSEFDENRNKIEKDKKRIAKNRYDREEEALKKYR